MLSGRCVALGDPRRLSPHSTACTHVYVGGLIATYRVSSSELSFDYSSGDTGGILGTAWRQCAGISPVKYTTWSSAWVRRSELSSHSATVSLCGSSLGASKCNIRSISTCCISTAASGIAISTCHKWTNSVLADAYEPSSFSSRSSRSSNNMNASATHRSCDVIPVNSSGDKGRACNVRNQENGAAGLVAAATGLEADVRSLVEDTTQDNWLTPLRRSGSVVALGKFDALHRGHCALAAAAAALSREIWASACTEGVAAAAGGNEYTGTTWTGTAAIGDVVLLSFSGMAAVLGWPECLPLTAPQDRGRVLSSWSKACSDGASADSRNSGEVTAMSAVSRPPRLRTLPFSLIRRMSPEQFVALLARDLGAAGVVAGRNYRFGFKAAGDADTLVRLGQKYGMRVAIVDLVTLPDQSTITADGHGSDTDRPSTSACIADLGSSSRSSSSGNSCDRMAYSSDLARQVALDATACYRVLKVKDDEGSGSSDGSGGGGGGSESGGGLRAESTSLRVSSSRIRGLLERGKVESVEQLLGRKYRLVSDLAGAATSIVNSISSISSSSNSIHQVDSVGCLGGSPNERSGCVQLFVPSTAYRNQPPANGEYRALVHIVLDSQVSIVAAHGGAGQAPLAEGQVSGSVCTMVELSDMGMHVELSGTGLDQVLVGHDNGLLLLDFDACG